MRAGWHRRCLFGRHGRAVVIAACTWEVLALHSPLPTWSELVKRRPPVGAVLLAALAHHWYLETDI